MDGSYSNFCISCGYPIGEERNVLPPDPDGDWMKYYRALYLSIDGTKLSEMCYTRFVWAYEEVWGGFEGNPKGLEEKLGPWYAMANSKPCKAHIFHESCWTIFREYFEHDVDLDKLFEVCKDISPIARSVCRFEEEVTASERHTFPLKKPELQGLSASKNRRRFPRILKKRKGKRHFSLDTDCFRRLPLEIRTEIAVNISTSDFLTLRQSSRSMGEVFGDQAFWRSRFIPCGDRGFLNSLLKAPSIGNGDQNKQGPGNRDWRSIYRCTAKIGLEDGHLFEFRRRWHNNQWLRKRYTMTKASEEILLGSYNNLLSEMSWKGSISTLHVNCDRVENQGTRKDLCSACGMEHIPLKQAVPLSDTVISIEVYTLYDGTYTFITGFGLMEGGTGKQILILGYRVPGQYMVIDLDGRRLMGFKVAVGLSGIRAIQPIFEDGLGRWAGDLDRHNTACKEVMTDTGVKAFSGHFDYCRMTRFSIA